jgi:hypothetical protein
MKGPKLLRMKSEMILMSLHGGLLSNPSGIDKTEDPETEE